MQLLSFFFFSVVLNIKIFVKFSFQNWANVTPVFKKAEGDKSLAAIYHPISLPCILGKVLEHIARHLDEQGLMYEPRHEKTCFCHMQTTKVKISLRIHAVWSAPLLFAAWIV